MSEAVFLVVSLLVFIVLAKYTDKCVYVLFSLIKGGALILIGNWLLELFKLPMLAVNLFTCAVCGICGLPGAVMSWIIMVFL